MLSPVKCPKMKFLNPLSAFPAQMQDNAWKAYLNGDTLGDWQTLAPLFDKAAEGGHLEDLKKGLSRLIKGRGTNIFRHISSLQMSILP